MHHDNQVDYNNQTDYHELHHDKQCCLFLDDPDYLHYQVHDDFQADDDNNNNNSADDDDKVHNDDKVNNDRVVHNNEHNHKVHNNRVYHCHVD